MVLACVCLLVCGLRGCCELYYDVSSVLAGLFTLKTMISLPLPLLEARLSPRSSKSKTTPSASRTFLDICTWPELRSEARQLEENLDDTKHAYQNISFTYTGLGISSPADECEVRGALVAVMHGINDAAKILGIGAECVGGGSGRSLSFTDLVVRKRGQVSNPEHLSALILGAGEVKGAWQLELQRGEKLEDMLRDPKRIDTCVLALQQASHLAFDTMASIDVRHPQYRSCVCAHAAQYSRLAAVKRVTPALEGLGLEVHDTCAAFVGASCVCYGHVDSGVILIAGLQAYGDAIIDEAPLLFVSNYHCTVFLKRSEHVHNKQLWASEPIWWDQQQPSARSCWLRFLQVADELQDMKPRLPRMVVPRTAGGYVLPRVGIEAPPLPMKKNLRLRAQPAIRLIASSGSRKGMS